MSYLPFRPIKGQAFTLPFTAYASGGFFRALTTYKISKDGAAHGDTTNTASSIGLGLYTIVFTATEMDADYIIFGCSDDASFNNDTVDSVVIFTMPQELSAIPTTNSTLHLRLMEVHQYLTNKREVTATTETMYKNDGSTTIGTSTLSDNGTTFTHGAVS